MASEKKWPFYFGDQILVKDITSNIGIITLWTKKENVLKELKENYCAVGQLYSREEGISAIVRNCLANKNIRHLIITGHDLNKSGEALLSLFEKGVDDTNNIIGMKGAMLDKEIPKTSIDDFRKNVKIYDMRGTDFSMIDPLLSSLPRMVSYGEPEFFPKPEIKLPEVFPNDPSVFKIREQFIGDAWLKILQNIMRFGVLKPNHYGDDAKELINISTVITEEDPDNPRLMEFFDFDKKDLDDYIPQVTTPKKFEGVLYTYGQRLRDYNGIDQIAYIIEDIKRSIGTRRAIAFTWNVEKDMRAPHSPCIDMVHVIAQDKLHMTAYIRSNDMFKAWPKNAYGLRKLQKIICTETGVPMGCLTTISGNAHVYSSDFRKILKLLDTYKPEYNMKRDPRGNIIIRIEDNSIMVTHLCPDGHRLEEFSGKTAIELYKKIVNDCRVSDLSHAMDVGAELQKAEIALNLGIPYIQDKMLDFGKK
ncbi:MAG: thymidylate synthase [Candidatus Aenigmatarchaeota archaeon]